MGKKILEDHKRKGKIFQPPLLSTGIFIETGWIDYAIPELIWILLLINDYGVDEGSSLSLEFSCIADDFIISKIENNGSAASMSSYLFLLSEKEKKSFIAQLKGRGILSKIQNSFDGFNQLYRQSPISFITKSGKRGGRFFQDQYLEKYKKILATFFDKTSFNSSVVMANVFNFLVTKNRFFVVEGNELPNLNDILNYPSTEKSKRVAAFLRSSIGIYFEETNYNRSNIWVKYFWENSIKIEPCRI